MFPRVLLVLALLWPLVWPLTARAAPDYVGSAACVDCHQDVAEAWEGSHHALAWTSADAAHVRADFGDTTFALGDMTAEFRLSDGVYGVQVTETDGSVTEPMTR